MIFYLPDIFIFVLGLAIGSFLNVCILRIPEEKKIEGRSGCPKCGYEIKFYDNIPVFSWLFLGGKCRNCKNPISKIYPFGELLTGILFLVVYQKYGLVLRLPEALVFTSILVVVSVIDFRHKIIPNVVLLVGVVLVFVSRVSLGVVNGNVLDEILSFVIGGGIGIGIITFHFLLFWIVTRKSGFGMGDFKLMFLLGAFLGAFKAIILFFLASFLGVILFLIFKSIEKEKVNQFAFGPALCLSAYIFIFIESSEIVNFLKF
ncbi:MAG: prepilin peptidase [Calditrichaeota bacterium]|nr:MAG: prepilin peptidase [Calditrichota bacterium]